VRSALPGSQHRVIRAAHRREAACCRTDNPSSQYSWEPSEVVVISPETDEEMHFAHLDGEHDCVLFVWWD